MSTVDPASVTAAPKPMTPIQEFWHYFKRRALDQRIVEAQSRTAATQFTLTEARAAVEAIEKEPLPEFLA